MWLRGCDVCDMCGCVYCVWLCVVCMSCVVVSVACWFSVALDPTEVRKLNLLSLISWIVILFELKAVGLKLHQP